MLAVRQFCAAINQQLDFRIEAANNLRFRENFKSEPAVVFPRLVERLCSERVLTMDLLEGVRETELAAAGIDPRQVAALGIKVFCKMAFIDGFVHADLHPGNIRFLRGERIALFDLGLTAELSHEDRLMFAQTMYYMANGMGRELARHMFELCRRLGPIDYPAYEAEMIEYLRRFTNRPLGEIEMASAIGSFFDIFRRYGMRLDGRFTVLNISFVVVEGLGKKLDPDAGCDRAGAPLSGSRGVRAWPQRRAKPEADGFDRDPAGRRCCANRRLTPHARVSSLDSL